MEILEEIKKMNEEVKSLISKQETEVKANGQANGETAIKLNNAIETLEKKNAELATENEKKEKRLADLEVKMNRPSFGGVDEKPKSLGEAFVESKNFSEYDGSGDSKKFTHEVKAITSAGASAGSLVRPDRDQNIYQEPLQLTFLADLFNQVPTSSNAIEVMRELVNTDGSAIQSTELTTKGESDTTFSLETYNVRTIANWLPASTQILDDAQRLKAFIDGRLTNNNKLKLDAQVMYGDGTGTNLMGAFVDPDVQDVGELPSGTTADEKAGAMIDHIRKAITKSKLKNYARVTAVVMNPQDFELIETAKGTDGHYILVNSPVNGIDRIWRVPIVESNTIVQNDFILGDFVMAGTVYNRMQDAIKVSDSHADLFVQNGLAILAECRKAFALELPSALVKGKFTIAA